MFKNINLIKVICLKIYVCNKKTNIKCLGQLIKAGMNFRKTKDELAITQSGFLSDRKLIYSIWPQSQPRPQTSNFSISSRVYWNFRFAVVPDFEKSLVSSGLSKMQNFRHNLGSIPRSKKIWKKISAQGVGAYNRVVKRPDRSLGLLRSAADHCPVLCTCPLGMPMRVILNKILLIIVT